MTFISENIHYLKQITLFQDNPLELLIAVIYLITLLGAIYFIAKKTSKKKPIEYFEEIDLYKIPILIRSMLSRTGCFSSDLQIKGNQISVWSGYFQKKMIYDLSEIGLLHLDAFNWFVMVFKNGVERKFVLEDRDSNKRFLDIFVSKNIPFSGKLQEYYNSFKE